MNTHSLPQERTLSLARVADVLLRLWYVAAMGLITLYVGWSFTRHGVNAWGLAASFGLALWIPFLLQAKSMKSLFGEKVAFVAVLLMLGVVGGNTMKWDANVWLKNSYTSLDAMLDPVQTFDEASGGVIKVTEKQQDALHEKLHGITYTGKTPMLASFLNGMAVMDEDGIRYVTPDGVELALSTTLPDQSIVYYKSRDTLVRAKFQDGDLYKIWERKIPDLVLHHWGDAYEGKMYLLGRQFVDLPDAKSAAVGHAYAECEYENSTRDVIYTFDTETSDLLRTIDLTSIIETVDDLSALISRCNDPLHTNDVQIIKTAEHASVFPDGKIGDFLISMRNISTILLVDKDTLEVKWHMTGDFEHQHSPRMTERNTIVLFDNQGGAPANGKSRVVEVDVPSRTVKGYWEASGKDNFFGWVCGKVVPMDNRIIVQPQCQTSRLTMFELECPEGGVSMACKRTNFIAGQTGANYSNAIPVTAALLDGTE